MKAEAAMKTTAELQRAIRLLMLLLSGQVKKESLPKQLSHDAILNAQGVVRALQWTLNFPDSFPLENLLHDIEKATGDPGFNPHTVTTE